jgi:hypothetical protein
MVQGCPIKPAGNREVLRPLVFRDGLIGAHTFQSVGSDMVSGSDERFLSLLNLVLVWA